jgi:flagellar hook protein FlgE
MMRSMFSGVSGLRNHQTAMDTIGNNIANVNTVGFKGGRTTFQDTLNQTLRGASAPNGNRGGINAVQVGLGMNLASIDIFQTQGNLQNTGKITDMALQGDGFFVLSDGAKDFYTRAGNFNIERDGRLTNPSNGLIVQGWMADILGNINNNGPVNSIKLPLGQTIAPIATKTVDFGGNLAADTNARYDNFSMPITCPDGTSSCSVQFKLIKTGFNSWAFKATVDSQSGSISGGDDTGTIILNENGIVKSVTGPTTNHLIVTPKNGTPVQIDFPKPNEINGGTFKAHSSGIQQAIDFSALGFVAGTTPQNLVANVLQDSSGHNLSLDYNITSTDGLHYKWTAVPHQNASSSTPPGPSTTDCKIVSGGTGTFEYNATKGIYNVSPGDTVIQSVVAGSPPTVTIRQPVRNDGMPFFNVEEQAPISTGALNISPAIVPPNPAWPPAIGSSATYNMPINNPEGELITTLHTTVTNNGPGPIDNLVWTVTADGGSVTGGVGSITLDSGTNSVTAENLAVPTQPFKITLNNGVSLLGHLPTAALPAGTPPQFTFGATGDQASSTKFVLPTPVVTVTKVYDSLGSAHNLTTTAVKVGDNNWTWSSVDENQNEIGNGEVYFNPETGYRSTTGTNLHLNPIGADPMNITLNFEKLTQGSATLMDDNGMPISELNSPYQDGYPLGQLQAFNVDKSGRIIGVFSNGMNQNLAQVAVASFTNPAGLGRTGDTIFEESSNSGTAQIGQAGMSGRGQITPGATEMSNVDLSQEFTDMIVVERGFQANSKIITTTDEMLQDLVNLKR